MYTKHYYKADVGQGFHYLKYMPKDVSPDEKLPLVIYMHGMGERGSTDGSEVDLVSVHGYFKYIKQGKEYPVMMVAPQCPIDNYWGAYVESLGRFLDHILAENSVDVTRVYLTGNSMGGTATWLWSLANPERFAAIAPVCGEGISWYGGRLCNVPIRAFHGDCDTVVSPHQSLAMVSAANLYGKSSNASLTLFPGVGHNAWDYAYNDELIEWFLQHKRV